MILTDGGGLQRKPKSRDPGIKAKSSNKAVPMPEGKTGESLSETAWRMMPKEQLTQKEFATLPKKKPLTLKKPGEKAAPSKKRTQESLMEQALKAHAALVKKLAKT